MLGTDLVELTKTIQGLWPKTPEEQIQRHFKRFRPWELPDVQEAYGLAYDEQDRRDKSMPSIPAIAERLKGKRATFFPRSQSRQDDEMMLMPDDYPLRKDPVSRKWINKETGEARKFSTMEELRALPEIQAWHEKRDRENAERNKNRPHLLNFKTVGQISDTMGGGK